ncbi:MAG: hypothetical protein LUH15_15075 [Tannerellaceae bacterium]|nr:hypothetical protein [Tannerellaceae bacterium]
MPRLIIVSGASGAGKSFLLRHLHDIDENFIPLKKATTRPHRQGEPLNESLDLIFNSPKEVVRSCDYKYTYCSHHYGIFKQDIYDTLSKGLSPIIIVADCETILEIKKDFKNALVLYVQNILSGEDLRNVLAKEGDPIEIEERIRRQNRSFQDYSNHLKKKLFDYVLINNFSEEFVNQITSVIHKEYTRYDSNYIFVIMSFLDKYNEVYKAFKHAGRLYNKKLNIERVDENKGYYIITEKIESCINKAGLIFCDITEMSPNVFYEFGYARAKNKDIIITAKTGTILPFDIRQYRTVFYDTPLGASRENTS